MNDDDVAWLKRLDAWQIEANNEAKRLTRRLEQLYTWSQRAVMHSKELIDHYERPQQPST